MKRKLGSLEKGKGIQSITKFFKSLGPQTGNRRSCGLAEDPAKMKTTKTDEHREPILENHQVASAARNASCMDKSAEKSKENSHNSENEALLNDESISATSQPEHSTPITDTKYCKKTENKIYCPAVVGDQGELTSMDCGDTFYSADEDSACLYNTCHGSFTSTQNQGVDISSRNEPGVDAKGSENKESLLLAESNRREFSLNEESSCVDTARTDHDSVNDHWEKEESIEYSQQISKAPAVSLPWAKESLDHDKLNVNIVNKDPKNSNNDLIEGDQNDQYSCGSFDSSKCVKDSSKIIGCNSSDLEKSVSFEDCKDSECDETFSDLSEVKHNANCELFEKPSSDLDRDSNHGISEGSSSSDEDLLTPPIFLSSKFQLKPIIKTPEKGVAPSYCTPSPIISDVKREEKIKYKLSFDKLIKEKAMHGEKDAELAEMEAELQRGLERGGICDVHVPSAFSDIESEEELFDDGRDLKDCMLPKDIKKFLVDVHDFSEELSGEDIFPLFHPYVTDVPSLLINPSPECDTFEGKLVVASSSDLQELLCGGWILQHYLDRFCPADVAYWLFQILCRHRDQHIISSSFQILWTLTEAATEKRDDLPPNPRGSLWVPSIKKIMKELLSLGATIPTLYPGDLVDALNIKEMFSAEISSGEIQMDPTSSSPQTECFPVVNIMHLVQFVTHCLQKCPKSFTIQDLRNLVVMFCRLALDMRLQTVVFDVEMCLAAVMNCYGEMQWPDEIKELCSIVAQLSTDHRSLLHLVELQPPSIRGIQLQRLLSMTLLHWLVSKFCRQEESGMIIANERCKASVPDDIEVSKMVKLVEQLKPGEKSDYYLLHTIISLVSHAVGSEDLLPKQRGALEKLTNKLRLLNGDIKDPRATFMNRTKVKDLLVRTILRLDYMTQCIKPPREENISSYFELSGSGYQVELLKETENTDNKEELSSNEDEEGETAHEMDCTFELKE
ncbi:SMC5-SMC6 complex localization factor protein 2-like isoform X1 [Montipora foliosa]|uniref:SMC5-SMC6 complex localization factor protein 2-like isoform X1 n=2 Tax=Montipora foliosa TaxID=591990 RepID=UPI0035F155A0